MEARPSVYGQRLIFESSLSLFRCIESSNPAQIATIKDVTLRLTDIDTSVIFSRPRDADSKQSGIMTLYEEELQRLDGALMKLSDLRRLTILEPPSTHSYLFRDLVDRFARLARTRLVHLEELNLPVSLSAPSSVRSTTPASAAGSADPKSAFSDAREG